LEKFETVLGLKPEAREEAVASYNVACCYSQLKQIDGALSALEQAMEAGFDNYKVNYFSLITSLPGPFSCLSGSEALLPSSSPLTL
jgi:tetratricopeptide (TPR) repeat protein